MPKTYFLHNRMNRRLDVLVKGRLWLQVLLALAYKSCLNRINETPSYDLFNLWAEWQRRLDKSVNLSVFVNNLTDNCSYLAGAGQV